MRNKIIILLICCLSAIPNAVAQLRFASLQDLWAYADTHNIQLKAAEAGKAIAILNLKQARGALLPTVSANGAFTDNVNIQSTLIPANLLNPAAPVDMYTEATFGRRYIYNGSISTQFDILNTKDWFTVKAARLNKEIAELNIAAQKISLYGQLANAYCTYILLNKAENLFEENVQTAGKTYQIASYKFKEGLISEVTLNTALINQLKAQKALEATLENKVVQLNALKSILNTSDSIVLAGVIQGIIPSAGNNFGPDPDVNIANIQMQLARDNWRSSKAALAPILSAVYQFNTQIAADEFLKFNNSNTTPQQYWGLRLSISLFSGNTRKYQVQKSKIEYELMQKQLENTRLKSEITNHNMLIAYNSSWHTYVRSGEILSLYKKNDTHAEIKLSEGVISMEERLKSYAELIASENEYLQTLSEYLIQQYRLQIRQSNFIK